MRNKVKGRLIFYVGQIEPVDLFTNELILEFEKMDYEVFIYDLQQQSKSLQELTEFCKAPVDAVITFNTMFYNMQLSSGKNAWDELGIRYITILVDHPDNFKETLLKFSGNEVVLCIDRNHMNYIGRFLPNVVTFGFLAHGGKEIEGKEGKLPYAMRKMDVMYAGGIPNANFESLQIPMELIAKYEDFFDVKEFVVNVSRFLLLEPTHTVELAIEEVLHNIDLWLEEDVLSCVISDFMFLHSYILAYYRERVLACIAESGIEIYIYGAGWEIFDWSKLENVHLMGMISAEQVLKEMNNAKIVLSTMAWFKDGSHERVFNGMLAKALVVSETSLYMKEIFSGSELDKEQEVLLYELNELEQLPQRIKYMLEHEEKAEAIIERGYHKAKMFHTWKMRAKEIAEELLEWK